MKKLARSALYLLLSVSVFLGCVLCTPVPAKASGPDRMEVHFMDVGQGDATLVTCGGHAMLIDTGDDTKARQSRIICKNRRSPNWIIWY